MNEQSNFTKIRNLLHIVNEYLRALFLQRWRDEIGQDWTTQTATLFIKGRGKKLYKNSMVIQKEALDSGDVNRWDTPLLIDVLLRIRVKRWANDSRLKEERQMFEVIKQVRNFLYHHPSMHIEDDLFQTWWEKAVPVLEFFGGCIADVNELVEDVSQPDAMASIAKAEKLKEDGNAAYREGKHIDAVKMYTKAISLPGLPATELAILYSNRSTAHLGMSKVDTTRIDVEYVYLALQDAKEAVNLNRTWYRGYFRAANAYMALEKFGKALEYLDSALGFCPARPDLITARDICRLKLGEQERQEHLDPFKMLPTEQELLQKIKIMKGLNDDAAAKQFSETRSKLTEELILGTSEVRQAHMIRLECGDYKRAASLYRKAAALGNADGIYNLAIMRMHGNGVQQNFERSIKLMHEAATKPVWIGGIQNVGVVEAQHALGLAYQEGTGVKEDWHQAAAWYKKASDLGCHTASNNLGIMYLYGRGDFLDPEKGVQYLKLAASQGNIRAMYTLANYFLNEGDPEHAREYFNRAVKHGYILAQLNAADFEAKLQEVEMHNLALETKLAEHESIAGVDSSGLSIKDRATTAMAAVAPDIVSLSETSNNIYARCQKDSSTPIQSSSENKFDHHYREIESLARNGSETARTILTTMKHFERGSRILVDQTSRALQHFQHQMIHEFAESFRREETVVRLPLNLVEHLHKIIDTVLNSILPTETSNLDINARICYAYTNLHNLAQCAHFVKCSKLKYPEEIAFHHLHSFLLCFLKKFDEGLRETVASLEQFPNDVELSYIKAVHMRCGETSSTDDVISAYETFINLAPQDHKRLPESFYAIANQHFNENYYSKGIEKKSKIGKSSKIKLDLSWIPNVEEFYQRGLRAEQHQLPCFLPYDSKQKEILERVNLVIIGNLKPVNSGDINQENEYDASCSISTAMSKTLQPSKRSYEKLMDVNRVRRIINHRYDLANCGEWARDKEVLNRTIPSYHEHKAPSQLADLNQITFSRMDPLEDKVYEGFVLQVTSIEDAFSNAVLPSIFLSLEDDNGDVMRAFIYNFPDKDPKVVQGKFGFGAKFSILNPYMRLAYDGRCGIRVDDASALVMHSPGGVATRCRFCGADNAAKRCARCKRASYCDKTCQQYDWKILKHKLICYAG